jgi:hypothetical protein
VGEFARYLGAVSLLMVAAIHAQQYYDAYFSAVPTIGRLFMLNIAGAGVTGLLLLAPVRLLGRRAADAILVLAAVAGIGIAARALTALIVGEYTPLFGFMEAGYQLVIELSLLFESLATLLLAAFIATLARDRHHAARADDNPTARRALTTGDLTAAWQARGCSDRRPASAGRCEMGDRNDRRAGNASEMPLPGGARSPSARREQQRTRLHRSDCGE